MQNKKEIEYYMLSYWDKKSCAWSRKPFMTLDEITPLFLAMVENPARWGDVQINSEKSLDNEIIISNKIKIVQILFILF